MGIQKKNRRDAALLLNTTINQTEGQSHLPFTDTDFPTNITPRLREGERERLTHAHTRGAGRTNDRIGHAPNLDNGSCLYEGRDLLPSLAMKLEALQEETVFIRRPSP